MKKQLWLRLKGYHFDNLVPDHLVDRVIATFGGADASTRAFAGKISHKLGWRMPFALRAIDEYRKFVYLGIVSDTHVTPPKVIDQVWHEHLLFSRAYREFCRDVVGREFDHHPELLPTQGQTDVFEAQYAATLALYETEFNVRPPADIWGTPKFDRGRNPDAPATTRRGPGDGTSEGDAPLHTWFDGSDGGHSHHALPEFGGGGAFAGGGGGSDWGGHGSSHAHGHSTDGADATHGDAGSSGEGGSGDGGSSDGGSGCSSSCGGCSS